MEDVPLPSLSGSDKASSSIQQRWRLVCPLAIQTKCVSQPRSRLNSSGVNFNQEWGGEKRIWQINGLPFPLSLLNCSGVWCVHRTYTEHVGKMSCVTKAGFPWDAMASLVTYQLYLFSFLLLLFPFSLTLAALGLLLSVPQQEVVPCGAHGGRSG